MDFVNISTAINVSVVDDFVNESFTNGSLMATTAAASGATADEEYAAFIYQLAENIFVWVFPFIMLTGLVGNTLSFLVSVFCSFVVSLRGHS